MNKILLAAILAILTSVVVAEEKAMPISAHIGVENNYVVNGVSLSDNNHSFFADVSATIGSLTFGAEAHSIDLADTNAEYQLFASNEFKLTEQTSIHAGVTAYFYPTTDNEFVKLNVSGTHSFTNIVDVAVDVDYNFETDDLYYGLEVSKPITKQVSVFGTIGHTDFDNGTDYNDYSVGVNYAILENVSLGAKYTANDLNQNHLDKDHWLASVTVGF